MNKQLLFLNTLMLATSLAVALPREVSAKKISAEPLPYTNDSKFIGGKTSVIKQTSLFTRRPDYREIEAQKKEQEALEAKQAELNKLKAEQEAKKAQEDRLKVSQQYKTMAVQENNKGVAFGKAGRWSEAVASHELACKYDPSNKQFYINLSAARCAWAQHQMKAHNYTAAAGLFRKALAAAPDNGLAGKGLHDALAEAGIDPNSADVRLTLGDQLLASGDISGATIEYQAAMQLENSGRPSVRMGDLAGRTGQIQTAVSWYKQALLKDPNHGPAHRQLGLVALAQKDMTGAASSLRKAVICDSKDAVAGQALIDIWRQQVAANPLLAENHLGLAGALQLTGDFAGAKGEYDRLEALDANHAGLASGRASLERAINHANAEKHKLAARTLFSQGLRREALAEISQSAMLEPKNAGYQFLLGQCLESVGDYQAAHQAYLTCVLIDPEHNQEAAARMRQMQTNATAQLGAQASPQFATDLGQKLAALMAQPGSTAQVPPAFATKVNTAQSTQSVQPAQSVQSAPQVSANSQVVQTVQSSQAASANEMSEVQTAESSQDYSKAIAILRDMISGNKANVGRSDLHHRLATNYLNSGLIADAVSEFRVASALAPTNKAYSQDLAKALSAYNQKLAAGKGAAE